MAIMTDKQFFAVAAVGGLIVGYGIYKARQNSNALNPASRDNIVYDTVNDAIYPGGEHSIGTAIHEGVTQAGNALGDVWDVIAGAFGSIGSSAGASVAPDGEQQVVFDWDAINADILANGEYFYQV